jgi:hypothetical protein
MDEILQRSLAMGKGPCRTLQSFERRDRGLRGRDDPSLREMARVSRVMFNQLLHELTLCLHITENKECSRRLWGRDSRVFVLIDMSC